MTREGLLVVDKPAGWTSHDVVAKVRRLAATRRVGHAGTLDPMATGILLLGIGRATKLLTYLVGADKTYTATIRLGQSTLTDDAEGEVTAESGVPSVDSSFEARLHAAVETLRGPIQQVPSAVSAIKVNGVRSYARVRGGEDVELAARPVTVHRFEIGSARPALAGDLPVVDVDVEVRVSSGTYVRALARDLGERLGVGGHLTALRRTAVGAITLADASPLDDLVAAVERGAELPVTPAAEVARAMFPLREVTEAEAQTLRYGQRLVSGAEHAPVVAAVHGDELVAILDETRELARSTTVFPA